MIAVLDTAAGLVVALAPIVVAVALILLICWVLWPPVVVVHEWTHAATLERFGVGAKTVLDGPEISGRVWPTHGGHVEPTPLIRGVDLSSWQMITVALAPLSIAIATAPIPVALALATGAPLADLGVLLVGWLIVFGPSPADWGIAIRETLGRPVHVKPALSAHTAAEGIDVGPR